MKKIVLSLMVLGSASALAACGNESRRDATLTQAPYAEERTVGSTAEPVRRPVVRSAQPVFEQRQMK